MARGTQVTILGLDRLNKRLTRVNKDLTPKLEAAQEEANLVVLGNIPGYPPPIATSPYKRTGTLGRNFSQRVDRLGGNQIVGYVGNPTKYAPWVISEKKLSDGRGPQARVHRDRWYTLQKVVEDSAKDILRVLRGAVKDILRGRR